MHDQRVKGQCDFCGGAVLPWDGRHCSNQECPTRGAAGEGTEPRQRPRTYKHPEGPCSLDLCGHQPATCHIECADQWHRDELVKTFACPTCGAS